MYDDPEFAEAVAGQVAQVGRPSWGEYDPNRAALDDIFDRIGELIAAVYDAAGGSAKPPPAKLRPVTEIDRARLRLEKQAHDDLVAEVQAAQERWAAKRREARDAGSQ